jgi:hypothetical protein
MTLLSTGDVICVKGRGDQITQLGATGGFMGHVLLILAPPTGVHRDSYEARKFLNLWPLGTKWLYIVQTGESCRKAEGFCEKELLMYIDSWGQIMICGEINQCDNGLEKYETPTPAQFFCCPPELREQCCSEDMEKILRQMRKREANWSWGTAVRAFLFSADVSDDANLESIKACWEAAPICTTVIIGFWQRYMCKLADEIDEDAMEWITPWMPLMADRTLPGQLMSTMEMCGWVILDSIQESNYRS